MVTRSGSLGAALLIFLFSLTPSKLIIHPQRSITVLSLAISGILAAFAPAAQAQSLVELYDSARAFDATYLSAKLQYDANLARA